MHGPNRRCARFSRWSSNRVIKGKVQGGVSFSCVLEHISQSCYIVSLINIDTWPSLRINNFQQMNQTSSLAETSTLHDLRTLQVLIDQSEKYVSET